MSHRKLDLLATEKANVSDYNSVLHIAIKGQSALTVKQLFTMEKMYVNWDNWRVRIAVWLISKTNFINR